METNLTNNTFMKMNNDDGDRSNKNNQVNVIDLQSPEKDEQKDFIALNMERVHVSKANLMKMGRRKNKLPSTKVGVLFKPNEFMDNNLLKSERGTITTTRKKNKKKKKQSPLVKQQMYINKKMKMKRQQQIRQQRSKSDTNLMRLSSTLHDNIHVITFDSSNNNNNEKAEFTSLLLPPPKNLKKTMRNNLMRDNNSNVSPRGSFLKTYKHPTLLHMPQGKKVSAMRSNYDTLRERGFLNPMQISSISNDNSMYVTNLNISEYFKQSMDGQKLSNIQKEFKKKLHSLKFYRTPTPERLKRENKKPVVLSPSASIESLNHSLSKHERLRIMNLHQNNNNKNNNSSIRQQKNIKRYNNINNNHNNSSSTSSPSKQNMNFAKKRRDFPPRLHVVHPNNNIVTSPLNSPTSYSSNNNFVKQSNSNPFGACLQIRNVSSRGNLKNSSVSGLVFSSK